MEKQHHELRIKEAHAKSLESMKEVVVKTEVMEACKALAEILVLRVEAGTLSEAEYAIMKGISPHLFELSNEFSADMRCLDQRFAHWTELLNARKATKRRRYKHR